MKQSNIFKGALRIALPTAIFALFNVAQKPITAQSSTSIHLTMGNPTSAGTSNLNNYRLIKSQYVTSHNCARNIPNWVSWQLNSSWLGSTPRQDDFRADLAVPSSCYRVQGTDYQGSGFDRGHTLPSADRTNSVTNNSATFLMTNIMPQAPDNNQGVWVSLENYSRDLVRQQGRELYILAGTYGTGGTGSNGYRTSITTPSGNRITIPARTWKLIVVLDRPGLGVAGVTTNTRVIAVDIPNTQGVRFDDWRSYRISVDELERRLLNTTRVAYDFLSQVPDSIESVIESRVDTQ